MSSARLALSVVIPAFNEAARIAQSLDTLRTQLPSLLSHDSWELRIVDDGSSDETARIVDRLSCEDRHIVLQREPHRGKGGAAKAGLLAARGDLRFLCDADLSMPVGELTRFLAVVPAQCDIAIGSREGAGARRVGEPAYRHVMGRAFNALVRTALLPGIQDTQCGFKLFTARVVEELFPLATIDGWAFDLEILHAARHRGYRLCEVPIEWHYRGRSHVSALRDPFRMVRDLWRIRTRAARGAYGRRAGGSVPPAVAPPPRAPTPPASPPADRLASRAAPEGSRRARSSGR